MEARERFWAKVDKNGPTMPHMTTRCWVWTGARSTKRAPYGVFCIRHGKLILAHRQAYEWAHGSVPPMLDHICTNDPCVRPLHLRPATNKQNQENRRGPTKRSQSGVRGVWWDRGAWVASVCDRGVRFYLGRFAAKADAETAVIAKRRELFTHNSVDR